MIQQGNKQQVYICYIIGDPTLPLLACDCIPSFSPHWVSLAPRHVFRNQRRSCQEIWILWVRHVALYCVLVLSTKTKYDDKLHAWYAYQTKVTYSVSTKSATLCDKWCRWQSDSQVKSAKWKLLTQYVQNNFYNRIYKKQIKFIWKQSQMSTHWCKECYLLIHLTSNR